MTVALIRGAPTHVEHIITQPEHSGPFGPVSHHTLCGQTIHHGPETTIRGPLDSKAMGDLCRRCEERAAWVDMAEEYARALQQDDPTEGGASGSSGAGAPP